MPIMYKIVTAKANAHEVHNTERPTKGSGHGRMIDLSRNSTYERPFTQEGNYLVNIYALSCFYDDQYPAYCFKCSRTDLQSQVITACNILMPSFLLLCFSHQMCIIYLLPWMVCLSPLCLHISKVLI